MYTTPYSSSRAKPPVKKKKTKPMIVTIFCPEHQTSQVTGRTIHAMSDEFLNRASKLVCGCGRRLEYRTATDKEIYLHVYTVLGEFKNQLTPSIAEWLWQTDQKNFGWIKRMRTNLIKQLAKDLPKEIQELELGRKE